MRNLFALLIILTLALLTGCTSWNSGVSAANTYTSAQLTAQQNNVQGVHDNTARAWVASGCGISYGELVRNGSGNNALAKAVVALCGAPSGLAVLATNDSGVNTVLSAGGFVKKSDLSAKLQALIAAEIGATATAATATANSTASEQ
jgi:hypothetical protein